MPTAEQTFGSLGYLGWRACRSRYSGCAHRLHRLPYRELSVSAQVDEAGWNAIIELMKNANVTAIMWARTPAAGLFDHAQKELAAYLASRAGRARAP
jgi:hypothetical protein